MAKASKATRRRAANPVEYRGAIVDVSLPMDYHDSGYLQKAWLASDFAFGTALFRSGTEISFFEDGTVYQGTLKQAAEFGAFSFIDGIIFNPDGSVWKGRLGAEGRDANLTIPALADIELIARRVLRIAGNGPNFSLLGIAVRGGTSCVVHFDTKRDVYDLEQGSNANPYLVARFTKELTVRPSENEIIPIIAPAGCYFDLNVDRALMGWSQRNKDLWFLNQRYSVLGYMFPQGSRIAVRQMNLVGVDIAVPVTLDGFTFPGNTTVKFDPKGKVVIPGP